MHPLLALAVVVQRQLLRLRSRQREKGQHWEIMLLEWHDSTQATRRSPSLFERAVDWATGAQKGRQPGGNCCATQLCFKRVARCSAAAMAESIRADRAAHARELAPPTELQDACYNAGMREMMCTLVRYDSSGLVNVQRVCT